MSRMGQGWTDVERKEDIIMVKSMFAAVSGLKSHQSKMDVIGNNIANVNTWGFKGATVSFKDAVYQNVINSSAGTVRNGANAGVNASQVGYGAQVASIAANFKNGGYATTDDPMNMMIDGNTFFMVGSYSDAGKTADQLYMTRVGEFKFMPVDEGGTTTMYLVDSQGSYVYGVKAADPTADDASDTLKNTVFDADYSLVPIGISRDDLGLADGVEIDSYSVDQSGVISCTDTDGKSYIVGLVALGNVPNPNGMTAQSGSYYSCGGNSGDPVAVVANGSTNKIIGSALELSNVDLSTELTSLITTQRGFQANSKIITVTDEMLETMVNMKR